MTRPYRVIGVESSLYTVKVRAVLRYRHLPHRWVPRFPRMVAETAHVRPAIMPVVQFPDGSYHTDSTPILFELEAVKPGVRSILPDDPGRAFLAHLIEDFADEWLAKCLFHYRFAYDEDSWFAARWVMSDAKSAAEMESLPDEVTAFRALQISRMPRVGSIPEHAQLLEDSYRRVLVALETTVANERFLFGTRPSLADFGLFGPLKTMATDPTPLAVLRKCAPYTEHWVRRLDDASGVEGAWAPAEAPLARAVTELLEIIGELYLPYLVANASATDAGEASFRLRLGACDYEQPAFPYHRKCLQWLRESLESLDPAAREELRPTLEATGCWNPLCGT